jgi:1-acyl-sn-glycerol-3-phosphate acyltransferase
MKWRWKISWPIAYLIFRWILGAKVHGREHIPQKDAVLIAGNHMSFIDPPLMGYAAKRECFFLAKEELFGQSKFFHWLIAYYNAIPIKRGKAFDMQLFKKTYRLIRKGQVIILFPEGTRSLKGVFLPFKTGVGMLALRYNVPVVPAYIKNTYRPVSEWITRRSQVEVYFAPALYPEGPSKDKKAYEEFTKCVEREVHSLADIAHGRISGGSRREKIKRAERKALNKPINPKNKSFLYNKGKVQSLVEPGSLIN